jgi:hypothetical protein
MASPASCASRFLSPSSFVPRVFLFLYDCPSTGSTHVQAAFWLEAGSGRWCRGRGRVSLDAGEVVAMRNRRCLSPKRRRVLFRRGGRAVVYRGRARGLVVFLVLLAAMVTGAVPTGYLVAGGIGAAVLALASPEDPPLRAVATA